MPHFIATADAFLFLVRCWRLPFGAATLMFTATAFGLSAMEALEGGEMVLSALLGGLGTDLLVRVLRPSHERSWRLRAMASLAPGLLWLANFIVIDSTWGIGWSVHLWTGTVCVTMLTGLAAAWLVTPPRPTYVQSWVPPLRAAIETEGRAQ